MDKYGVNLITQHAYVPQVRQEGCGTPKKWKAVDKGIPRKGFSTVAQVCEKSNAPKMGKSG